MALLQSNENKGKSLHITERLNEDRFTFAPVILELSGRMNSTCRRLIKLAAKRAAANRDASAVGPRMFRAKFCYYWRKRISVVLQRQLADGALRIHSSILNRIPENHIDPREFDLNTDVF
jgi:hypothetical protein